VRELSIRLLTLGSATVGLFVVKGFSNGRLLASGSNNRLAVFGGLALVGLGLLMRQPMLVAVLCRSDEVTPAFLARVQSKPLFHARLSFWFGVVAGLLESGYRAYHTLENPWPHSLWLAPLASGALFGSVGVVLTMVLRDRGLPSTRLALGLILTMALSGWVFLVAPEVYPGAAVVLAAGIATVLSRVLAQYFHLTWPVIANSGRVALLVTLGMMGWTMPSALGPLAAANGVPSAAGGRNVVLLVLDTVRASELSMLGYQRPTTPNLERWARRGVVFESAFSTAPWTLPSHAGIFTGRWAHELTDTSTMDGRFPTIAEVMRENGYATSGFVANLAYTTRQVGVGRGFDHYEDFVVSAGEALQSTALGRAAVGSDWLRNLLGYHELINRKPASRISADFLRWLDHNRSRPFFAFLNYFDAHEPYMPSEGDAARFRIGPAEDRGPFEHRLNNIKHADWHSLSASQVAQERALHEAAIAGIDREIGALLDGMESRGLLSNTVVIVTADHGEAFGEHGVFSHGTSLYADLLHVPLLIIEPAAPDPVRVRATVSLRDLPETVLDLAGLEINSPFPGASLSRFWRSSVRAAHEDPLIFFLPATPVPEYTPLARGTMHSVIADPYHYILNGDGIEELFNYRADPLEQRNLAGSSDASSLLPRLRSSLPKRVN
jgi:arylsulfatase A-like enzyme